MSRSRPLASASTALVAGLCAFLGILTLLLKLRALHYWQYTSDLFTFDQMLGETLRGRFGLEYTYGDQFGEHAYLTLLLLLPLKLALKTRFVYVLAALTPLAYGACGLMLLRAFREPSAPWKAPLAAFLFLANAGVLSGLLEDYYGFHPDIAASFIGVVFAALLAREHDRREAGPAPWPLYAAFALMVASKEDFALSACAALALLALRGVRRARPLLLASAGALALELLLVASRQTLFNRTDAALAREWWSQPRWPPVGVAYWTPWLLLGAVLLGALAVEGELDLFAGALLVMAASRLPGSLLTADFNPASWHNLPTAVFLMGAVMLQLVRGRRRGSAVLAAALAAALGLDLFARRLPPLLGALTRSGRVEAFQALQADLQTVIARTEPGSVTAIPLMTAMEWARAGRRFSFYPRGVTVSPAGIARYAVLLRGRPPEGVAAYAEPADEDPRARLSSCYRALAQSAAFLLYERSEPCPELDESRARFVRRFGAGSIR